MRIYGILRLTFFIGVSICVINEWLIFEKWLLVDRVIIVTSCWFHVLRRFQVIKLYSCLTMLLLWVLWVTMVTNVCMKGCTFKHNLLSILLHNLLHISVILINDLNLFLFYWRLLLYYAFELLIFTVLCNSDSWIYLALHLLVFSFTLDLVPVSRLTSLVSDLLRLLMWLTIVVWSDSIGVVNGQVSSLRLWKLPILVLINLNLLLNAF